MPGSPTADKRTARGRQPAPAAAETRRLGFLGHPHLALAARLIIGAIFVVSAAGKLLQPDAFIHAVDGYGVVPAPLLVPLGLAFPWLELAVGVCLLVGLFIPLAALGAAALLVMFVALMLSAVIQGKVVDCGCFIGIIQETVGPTTLIRDSLMIVLLPPIFLAARQPFSLDGRWRARGASLSRNLALAAPVAVAILVVGVGVTAVFGQAQAVPTDRPADGWRLGPANAKVEVVVYSDFECPACRAVAPYLSSLVDKYKGSVALVYKHFPLPQHESARADAEAAEAAGEQGRFWQMHDAIFANYGELTPVQLRALAGQLGLDLARYDAALSSGRPQRAVDADFNEGVRIGVSYTPYILVGGKVVSSNDPQTIEAAINRKLGQ